MARKQFTFYRSFWEAIGKLTTNKEKLQAYEAICAYALDGTEPDEKTIKPAAATVFCVTRPVLETARKRSRSVTSAYKLPKVLP